MPAPAWDSIFTFVPEESHLMGHGCPIWPIKVKTQTRHLLSWPRYLWSSSVYPCESHGNTTN